MHKSRSRVMKISQFSILNFKMIKKCEYYAYA